MIDVRGGVLLSPPIKIGGYKMLDVANPEAFRGDSYIEKLWLTNRNCTHTLNYTEGGYLKLFFEKKIYF
jgi:hypothetical protein